MGFGGAKQQVPSPWGEQQFKHRDCLGKKVPAVCGVWDSFGDKLYFTRDIPEGKWVRKDLLAPVSAKPPTKRAKPPPRGMFKNSRSNGARRRS